MSSNRASLDAIWELMSEEEREEFILEKTRRVRPRVESISTVSGPVDMEVEGETTEEEEDDMPPLENGKETMPPLEDCCEEDTTQAHPKYSEDELNDLIANCDAKPKHAMTPAQLADWDKLRTLYVNRLNALTVKIELPGAN